MAWVHLLKSRYMCELTFLTTLLISVWKFPPIFLFLIKNGTWSVWPCGLWCTVMWSPLCKIHYWIKGCCFPFLTSFFAFRTVFSFDTFISVLWPCSRMNMLGISSLGLYSEWDKTGMWKSMECLFPNPLWGGWAPDSPSSRKELGQLGLWGQILVSALFLPLFWEVTNQVPLIWGLEAKSVIKISFTECVLCTRHSAKGFEYIIWFNFNSSKSPVR